MALILPHRPDGKIYTGVLTYSASTPVEVGLLNRVFVDSDTLSHIKSSYGKSIPNWIDNASSHHNLDESATQIIAGIKLTMAHQHRISPRQFPLLPVVLDCGHLWMSHFYLHIKYPQSWVNLRFLTLSTPLPLPSQTNCYWKTVIDHTKMPWLF